MLDRKCIYHTWSWNMFTLILIFKILLFLFLERVVERQKERNIHWREIRFLVASDMPLTGDLAHNPGMCPNLESNQWPFSSKTGAQPTEPFQPGLILYIIHKGKDKYRTYINNSSNSLCNGKNTVTLGRTEIIRNQLNIRGIWIK